MYYLEVKNFTLKMILSLEGERGVDSGKRFRCVAFLHITKGKEGRKERKNE